LGLIVKQSIINTIYSYVGVFLGAILTLWLYVTILEPAEYGLTRVLISVAFIGAQFSDFGFKNLTIRYFPYFRDKAQSHHGFLFWMLIIPAFGFLTLSGLLFLFKDLILQYYSDNSQLFAKYYNLLIILTFFTLYFNLLSSYSRALFNTNLISFLQEILLRLLIIFVLFCYWMTWIDQAGFMKLFVLTYGVLPTILFIYLIYRDKLDLKPDLNFFSIKPIKELASYGFFALMGGVATMLVGKIDILMLSAMAGLADTGVYAIAFYIGSVITIPQRSVLKIANPVVADALKNNDLRNVEEVYKKSSLNQLLAGSLILIGIWANLDNLNHIITPEYLKQPTVIIVIGLAKLFDMATGINGGIILNSKYYRVDLYTNIILIFITIIANYLLIPIYGILGAALGTMISIIIYNTTKLIFVQFAFSLQPFTVKTLQAFGVSVLFILLNIYIIPELEPFWLDLIVRSSIIALLFGGLSYWLNISEDANNLVDRLLWGSK